MGVYVRILIRYLAGYLVLKSVLPKELADTVANDPDVAAAVGVTLTVGVEGARAMAKRFGWST